MVPPAQYKRALPPAHYSLKIESFSKLLSLGEDKYDSEGFKAGGYRWSLSLYPNGNKNDNGSRYISLYLSIEEGDKLAGGRKVHVNYKLFVYNKSRQEYLTVQDAEEAVSSFHRLKTQRGFPRFLSLQKFKEDGYLDENDSCTFGAEVFVTQPPQLREEFFTFTPTQKTHTWSIPGWPKLGKRPLSNKFTIEGRQWKLLVYPKGDTNSKETSMSVYLEVQHLTGKTKVYAEFSLRVLDQLKKKHKDHKFKCWLSASHPRRGYADFMPLKDLQKPAKGFISNDTLIVEVEFSVISAKPIIKLVGV